MSNPNNKQINPNQIGFLAPIEPLFQIFVIGLKGQAMTFTVDNSTLVGQLKEQIAQQTNLDPLDQRLQYAGKQLEDERVMNDYNIQQESSLQLLLRLRGGIGERQAIQEFMAAEIVHGNVHGVTTGKSFIRTKIMRADYDNLYEEKVKTVSFDTYAGIDFNEQYEGNVGLQALCVHATLTETLNSGNCADIAAWTAVKLIENSTNQWVYICQFDRKLMLPKALKEMKARNNQKELRRHPLYDPDMKTINDTLDHEFVVTYPEAVKDDNIMNMDPKKATVVDAWYDNLVCSLQVYIDRLHPYYNYEYSVQSPLVLKKEDLKIKEGFQAIGLPFTDDKTDAKETAARLIEPSDKKLKKQQSQIQDALGRLPFQFNNNKQLKDERSIEELGNLIVMAHKSNQLKGELSTFDANVFKLLLELNNSDTTESILTTLLEMQDKIAVLEEFYKALVQCNSAVTNNFFESTEMAALVKGFVRYLRDNQAIKGFVLKHIDNFVHVLQSEAIRLDRLIAFIKEIEDEEWSTLAAQSSSEKVGNLIKTLTEIDEDTGALAEAKLVVE